LRIHHDTIVGAGLAPAVYTQVQDRGKPCPYNFGVIYLRPARAEDAPTIKAMTREARLDPTSLNWRHFTIAEGEGQIVGIAQVKPHADCREFGSFVVRREWRSRGVGKLLIETLLAREVGDVFLVCHERMVPYYLNYGFALIGFKAAPRTLQLKLAAAFLFRAFGVRVVAMKRGRAVASA
jgi:N-acetylglutamate synthase-like GNAT family acetyltransferase